MSEEQTKQNVSLEETFEQIETIIKQLESPEVTLDDSFRLYQAGVEKLKTCNLLLDTVEKKMQVMQNKLEWKKEQQSWILEQRFRQE